MSWKDGCLARYEKQWPKVITRASFSGPCTKKTQTEACFPVDQRKILNPPIDILYNVEKVTPRIGDKHFAEGFAVIGSL